MKWASLILFVSWAAYAASPCSQSGVIFCNGFEGTTQEIAGAWEAPTAGQYVVDDPGPFGTAGNKVLKLDAEVTTQPKHGLGAGYDRLYARWYQKFSPGYNFPFSHHNGFIFASDAGAGAAGYTPDGCISTVWAVMEPNTESAGLWYYVYHPGKATPWGDVYRTGTSLQTGQWYCVESMIDLGTPTPTQTGANGMFDTWIDGVHHGPNTCGSWPALCGGIWFRSCPTRQIRYISIMSHGTQRQPMGSSFNYYDDLVVSTQPIGCGARVPYTAVPLSVTTSTLAAGTVGTAYTVFLAASGGTKNYSWQVVGTLPPGLSITALTGNIKGTPTQAGTYSFTVRATDASVPPQTADKQFSILINPSTRIITSRDPAVLAAVTAEVHANRLLLQFPADNRYGTIRLLDALGHTVWEHKVKQGSVSVESPALRNGLYVGRIGNGNSATNFRFAIVR